MTARSCALLSIRLLALWFLVSAVANFTGYDFTLNSDPQVRGVQIASILSFFVIPLATGSVLWALSNWVSIRMVPEPFDSPLPALDVGVAHRLAVSLLGLWILVQVLPELLQATYLLIAMRFARPPALPRDEATDYKIWMYAQAGSARYATLVTRAVVGLALYLWPNRVAATITGGVWRALNPPITEEPGE